MRSFDPCKVGGHECRAWETYYQRRWMPFLVASIGMVRSAFGMSWPRTLLGAWLVLRANQKWAPFPDNDPHAARALMRRFYRLLATSNGGVTFDTTRAAELEVEWWRAHRDAQHDPGKPDAPSPELVAALRDLYAYTYGVPAEDVTKAAELRARAMDISDAWVEDGSVPGDARLGEERALLVRSYASLLAAVHR
jgi:hypothetical protein